MYQGRGGVWPCETGVESGPHIVLQSQWVKPRKPARSTVKPCKIVVIVAAVTACRVYGRDLPLGIPSSLPLEYHSIVPG